ncbi:MAG: hypothetical protein AB7L13_12285 [Acidimicrobiia bacterium]
MPHRIRTTAHATIAALALALTGCGDDNANPASTASSTSAPGSTTLPPPAGTTTVPGTGAVPAAELGRAQQAVMTFLESLGSGDVDAARRVVGPISEQRSGAAGGLTSMLRQSTEGHGAWPAATDREVTTIGFAPGLAVVVLEGTLRVEGTTEHRVAAFPVRKAESADTWFVEPWAYDLATAPPLTIVSPTVDAEERATVRGGQSFQLTVSVSARASGTVYVSYDGAPPALQRVSTADPVVFAPRSAPELVTVLYSDGPTLAATAFNVATS